MTGFLVQFGIPSLDFLLGVRPDLSKNPVWSDDCGIWLPDAKETTSMCIIGTDGTGKSILGLHLASRYLFQTGYDARVLYVSTDLSYRKALNTWKSFALDRPSVRKPVFENSPNELVSATRVQKSDSVQVNLDWYYPGDKRLPGIEKQHTRKPFAEYLSSSNSAPNVAFIDLAQFTAGDDWGFLNRAVAILESPSPEHHKHLLIVDAIEGFESLSGEKDAFGETLSRRSRISQILRVAGDKCHVIFTSSGSNTEEPAAERFVTDAVIRLRSIRTRDYSRRTVEIEKVRGQAHVRGEHPLTIRGGKGTNTGGQPNFDDPQNLLDGSPQAYVAVIPSVHCLSRELMERAPTREATLTEVAPFGIRHLDDLLVPEARNSSNRGLPFGTVTSLVGDPDTQKINLGRCFLAEAFRKYFLEMMQAWGNGRKPIEPDLETIRPVVLITTLDQKQDSLIQEFCHWFWKGAEVAYPHAQADRTAYTEHLRELLRKRVTCRRLEVHDIPNSVLLHIVMRTIEGASKSAFNRETLRLGPRVVVEDLSTWKEIYPDIRNEPLFLPALLFYLRRVGAASLIIDTHPGRPDIPVTDEFDSELRAMVDHHLYTWRVPYFGESRIAIAAIPPMSKEPGATVRELDWSGESERPTVNRNFENYTGIEDGKPKPVPLQISVLDEGPAIQEYAQRENLVLSRLFSGVDSREVITTVPASEYEAFQTVTNLRHQARIDHTLVVAVDEFWQSNDAPFRSQTDYLNQRCVVAEDSNGRFQPQEEVTWPMVSGTSVPGTGRQFEVRGIQTPRGSDRIPLMWDFGFLVCRGDLWDKHAVVKIDGIRSVDAKGKRNRIKVSDVWLNLHRARGRRSELRNPSSQELNDRKKEQASRTLVNWRSFLGACKSIARREPGTTAFDLGTSVGESLSCLILEVWLSEVVANDLRSNAPKNLLRALTERYPTEDRVDFHKLVREYLFDLYKATLLLIDVLPLEKIVDNRTPFRDRPHEIDPGAVASRHWYKSAVSFEGKFPIDDPILREMELARLPGHFSVRGDWDLAVAKQSRSSLLADQALDHITSRRSNLTRLHLGVGLPVRTVRNVPRKDQHRIHTALLSRTDRLPGKTSLVTYGELLSLGKLEEDDEGFRKDERFWWLWRSRIQNYSIYNGQWHRWLRRVFLAWVERENERTRTDQWLGGHAIYDYVQEYFPNPNPPANSELEDLVEPKLPQLFEEFQSTWNKFQSLAEMFSAKE